jgi:methylmalonyl-CoA mutase N-terminal domain/subunit
MKEPNKKYTDSGIEIKTIYTQNDVSKAPLPEGFGEAAGTFPFTRGIQADMYRGKLWTMRQYAGFSTAEESNKRYKYLLSQGVSGLSVAFDLPTQIGYDSDHELAGYFNINDDKCNCIYFTGIVCCTGKKTRR